MDKIMSGLKSNPDVANAAAEKAGELVEGAVKKALGGKGENGKTEAKGNAGVKVEGKAGESGAKVEEKGGFGLDDALGALQGEKKDSKDGGRNVKNVMGAFGL